MPLFETKDFVMHSGARGYFKIECDNLTDDDLDTLALITSKKYDFNIVKGVPTGGWRIEEAFKKYGNRNSNMLLIVDDVLTTGGSMEEYKAELVKTYINMDVQGIVLFARSKCADWIDPIFQMWEM